MLRGVNRSAIPATGLRLFDNPTYQSLPPRRTASGDMLTRCVRPTRDQALTGLATQFPSQKHIDSNRVMPDSDHASQTRALQPHEEQVTQELSPQSLDCGLVEATPYTVALGRTGPRSPQSLDCGLVEAGRMVWAIRGRLTLSPQSLDCGLVEAWSLGRCRSCSALLSAVFGLRPR
jgi:hypothetical protein